MVYILSNNVLFYLQKLVCKKNTSGTVQIYLDLGADVNWKDPDVSHFMKITVSFR